MSNKRIHSNLLLDYLVSYIRGDILLKSYINAERIPIFPIAPFRSPTPNPSAYVANPKGHDLIDLVPVIHPLDHYLVSPVPEQGVSSLSSESLSHGIS